MMRCTRNWSDGLFAWEDMCVHIVDNGSGESMEYFSLDREIGKARGYDHGSGLKDRKSI
jgi:hypothetical protein